MVKLFTCSLVSGQTGSSVLLNSTLHQWVSAELLSAWITQFKENEASASSSLQLSSLLIETSCTDRAKIKTRPSDLRIKGGARNYCKLCAVKVSLKSIFTSTLEQKREPAMRNRGCACTERKANQTSRRCFTYPSTNTNILIHNFASIQLAATPTSAVVRAASCCRVDRQIALIV